MRRHVRLCIQKNPRGARDTSLMQEKPEVRHCPVCGTAMVAEKMPANPEGRLRFSCLNCGAVIVLSQRPRDDAAKTE
jgi:predicted RNA-binding Zn-ribbon protein involved in translation (DUF1610 family)